MVTIILLNTAKLPLAPAELGRQWNSKIQVNRTKVRKHQCHPVQILTPAIFEKISKTSVSKKYQIFPFSMYHVTVWIYYSQNSKSKTHFVVWEITMWNGTPWLGPSRPGFSCALWEPLMLMSVYLLPGRGGGNVERNLSPRTYLVHIWYIKLPLFHGNWGEIKGEI